MKTIIFMFILFGIVSIPLGFLNYVLIRKRGNDLDRSAKTAKSMLKTSIAFAFVAWIVAGFLYVFYGNSNIHVSLFSINLTLFIFEISIGLTGYAFFVWKGYQVSKKIQLSGEEPADTDIKAREAFQKLRRLWLKLFATFGAVILLCLLANVHG